MSTTSPEAKEAAVALGYSPDGQGWSAFLHGYDAATAKLRESNKLRAPLVAAIRLCEAALDTPDLKQGRASQKHIRAWKAVRAVRTGTGEKR